GGRGFAPCGGGGARGWGGTVPLGRPPGGIRRLAGGSGRPDGVPGESLVGRGRPLGGPRYPPVSRIRRFAEDGSKPAGAGHGARPQSPTVSRIRGFAEDGSKPAGPGHGATFHPRASPRVVPGRWRGGGEAATRPRP